MQKSASEGNLTKISTELITQQQKKQLPVLPDAVVKPKSPAEGVLVKKNRQKNSIIQFKYYSTYFSPKTSSFRKF